MQSALSYNSSSIYIDGTKSIRRVQIFARYADVKVFKIIFLIRDGRAFCNSYRKNRNVSESDMIRVAKEWNQYIHLVDEFHKRHENIKMINVRYEDLCNNKNEVFDKMKEFLNLDSLSEFETDKLPSHILGNRMRKNFNFDIQEDNSWESELSSQTVSKIEVIMLRNLLLRYNYIN
ncbi:sulfotransferase [Salinimonas iocasae]|uniref:Sulfotransferase n=1 Tax=Salinimonas iocasae TaxID=2572577 RepID=A0A5B7YBH3_9ALTE|nr:sulfotransferase [Salinimonas iocasae]